MKLIVLAFLALWGIFVPNLVYAQTSLGKISGRIADATGKPVEATTVSLLSAKDSTLFKMELSDQSGNFVFEKLTDESYEIVVIFMGKKQYSSGVITIDEQHREVVLPGIILQDKSIQLQEVSITQKKAFVEHKIDRTVVNVDALISNAGTTALDVLEKSPGVRVDQNGVISLKGQQGIVIFIDDKPTYLSGADLEGYLRSLPSSSLDQIEIMTNPPAKYDAAGNAGVINIKTKKQRIKGFNTGINLSLGKSKYFRTNNSIDFNYRNNKFNLFGNLGYSTRNGFNDIDIFRRYKTEEGSTSSLFNQNPFIHKMGFGLNSILGADFYQSDKTTWGVVLNGVLRYPESRNTSTSNLFNAANQLDSFVVANNNEKGKFKNGGINLNYRHQFKKNGPDLTVDLDYIDYQNDNEQSFNNENYTAESILKSQDQLYGWLPSDIKIYSTKTDYTHPLEKNLKIAAGLKASYTRTDNIADYFYTINGNTRPDYDKTNHFNYKESINAAYLNLNKDFSRLSIQAGLRLENTSSNGHQLGNITKRDSSFNRNYTSLFPTLFLLYKLDSIANNQIRVNYGRRIDRPYYQDLNPFISPLDKFTYYVGNPYLQPSFSHKIELGYIFRNKITTSASYSDTRDQVNETIEIVNGTYYSRPANIGRTKVTSLSVDAGFDPTEWLSFQLYGELSRIRSKSNFYTGLLDTKGTYVYGQGMLQFKLEKGWSMQLDGYYQSKLTNAQFIIGSRGRLNAGVSKSLSPKATIKLSVSDIFYTNISQGIINNLYLTDATFRTLSDSRWAVLTLSLRFGKLISNQSRYETKGAENEKNRVKQ